MVNLESKYYHKWKKYVVTKLFNKIKNDNEKNYDNIYKLQNQTNYKKINKNLTNKLEDTICNIESNYILIEEMLYKYNLLNENFN